MTKPADIHIDKRFFNSFLIVSFLTFLAKMAIVIRELVVASRYGRQDEADAFLIAFLVPSFVVSILGNAMNASFIPVYIQVRENKGRSAAQKLFAGMSSLVVAGSLLVAGLIYLAAPAFLPAIASGFSGPKLAMTMHMLKWVTPYVVVYGVLSLWIAAVNAQENYNAVVLSPVITPLLIILLFLCCPSFGIWSLVYGTLGGAALELLVVGTILKGRGFSLGASFAGFRGGAAGAGTHVRQVVRQFLPSLAGAFLMGSTLIVDQSMAAMLPAGSVAALSYGNKVIGFLLTILATTLITILTPYFSKKLSGSSAVSMIGSLRKAIIRVFIWACVLPMVITVWSTPIIKFVFYRGAFTMTDVSLVAGVQSFLAWQIPFYITGVILVKFIASMQLNWIQAVVAAVNLVVNIVLNFWLMRRMGIEGIALSTTLVHFVSVLLLIFFLSKSIRRKRGGTNGSGAVGRVVAAPAPPAAARAMAVARPRRIGILLPDLEGGGAERTVVNLLKDWDDPDYHFELVLVNVAGVYLKEVPAGVKIVGLAPDGSRKRSLRAFFPLLNYLRRNKPELLISHLSHMNVLALLVKKFFLLDTQLILVEQSVLAPGDAHGKERYVRWLMKKLYPTAPRIVAVSVNTASDLETRLGLEKGRIVKIYNPVVTRDFDDKAAEQVSHPWLDHKDRPVFISVGRLVPQKGFDLLLNAFAKTLTERPARLIILGEGEMRKELEERCRSLGIGQDVWMPGFEQNPFAFMRRCDAFVLSSAWEGLPSVLIEAMACGCRLIATRSPGGQEEILESGKYGSLVPAGDVTALAEAMLTVPAAPLSLGESEKLKERAKDFSTATAVAAYSALFRECLPQRLPEGAALQGGPEYAGMHALNTIPADFGERKVLHIITGLGVGGAEQMLVNLVGGGKLRMDGATRFRHAVISLGTKEEGVLADELEKLGVQVQFLGMMAGALPGPGALMRLVRWSKEIDPGLIQGWMYHGNLAASFVRRSLPGSAGKVALTWNIHHSLGELHAEKRMTRWLIRLGAWLSDGPDSIIYVSQTSRRQHVALGYRDDHGCTIPNGVDTDLFMPTGLVGAAGAAPEGVAGLAGDAVEGGGQVGGLGIAAGALLVGHFARYHPLKDHANFLRAAARLSEKHRQVHYLMAGKGVDGNNPALTGLLRELGGKNPAGFADRVHLLGMRRDIEKLLTALDIFCLSSYSEALPLALLEAMASGLPCVTTDIGDAALVVGETGLAVPPRDPAALAAALGALVEAGPEKRAALGAAARERVIAEYSLGVVAGRYAELYERLMG